MRAFMILFILIAVVVGVIGYERHWFTISTESDNEHTGVNISINKEPWHKDRDDFHKQADAKLNDMQRKLDDLKARASRADASAGKAMNETIDELHRKYQAARAELQELDQAGQEKWQSAKTKLSEAMDDLRKGVDHAVSRFHEAQSEQESKGDR